MTDLYLDRQPSEYDPVLLDISHIALPLDDIPQARERMGDLLTFLSDHDLSPIVTRYYLIFRHVVHVEAFWAGWHQHLKDSATP